MAITLKRAEATAVADPADVLSTASDSVDPEDFHTLAEVGPAMRALATNRSFLANYFNDEVKRSDLKRLAQYLSPQSFVFAASRCGRYALRCNVGVKPEGSAERQKMEARIFSYGLPHNHNFSFLTAGYSGPGYRSRIYELDDPESVQGRIGERIGLRYLETSTLAQGDCVIYRRGLDVHTQLPPDRLSISLNLLVSSPRNQAVPQFYCDVDKGQIIGFPEVNLASKRLTVLRMASAIGDANTADLLQEVAKSSPCFRTRVGAAGAVCSLLDPPAAAAYAANLPFDLPSTDVSIGFGLGRDENYLRMLSTE